MKPKPHQLKKAKTIVRKLHLYGLAILAGEPRSGKTLSFVLAARELAGDDFLIITKKKAADDIRKITPNVTNFHGVFKVDRKYKMIILDESHRYISDFRNAKSTSKMYKAIQELCYHAEYVLFSSGTPTPESYAGLYRMLGCSPNSPWVEYKTLKSWHNVYGIPKKVVIGYNERTSKPKYANAYNEVKEKKVWKDIQHFIIDLTRKEAGHKYEPVIDLHFIPLTDHQKEIYDVLREDKLYEIDDELAIVCNTPSKYNRKLHQISGGFCNAEDINEQPHNIFIGSDKVDYIKEHFDPNETIIVAYYISEQEYLSTIFPHVASITKNSEGVDYSHFKNMVIYSMDFSAATYEQIIARQLNFETRKEEVIIHILLSGIDEDVYDAVRNKKSFTSTWYKEKYKKIPFYS